MGLCPSCVLLDVLLFFKEGFPRSATYFFGKFLSFLLVAN